MNRHVIACLLIAMGARCVLADPGDDFANNLFTDLSPLLALFGERVTMQFLSQAIGVADCIMLAMAPLGIITIIVSAIRVGGPMWLKATIGRARESLSRAEIELMSSTSKETSELWDGHNIVRCSGEGEIWQFICLVPKNQDKQKTAAPEIEVMSLDEAEDQDHKLLKPIEVTAWKRFRKTTYDVKTYVERGYVKARRAFQNQAPAAEPSSLEQGNSTPLCPGTSQSPTAKAESPAPQKIYVVRDLDSAPPNLTLNCHTYFNRYYHYAVALVGIVLQLLVLFYAGLITYRPTWKEYFLKNDKPMDSYAFPTVAVGTVLLAIGVFLCGHVVETSTEEDHYKAAEGYDAYIVWLQRSNTVGDQKFDPCAVYPVCKRQYVTFSRRNTDHDVKTPDQTKGRPKQLHGNTEGGLELLAMIATAVCLVGYLIQFIGLRGMNWSASIAQLVAVALMTILRALVRRDLDKKPMFNTLVNGYEIDWLAISLMSKQASWRGSTDTLATKSAAGKTANEKDSAKSTPDHLQRPLSSWTVITGEEHTSTLKSSPPPDDVSRAPSVAMEAATRADQALKARIRLGKLANWRGPVAIEAVKLTEAIEAAMAALVPKSKSSSIFSWNIPVRFEEVDVTISVQIKWINGAWKAPADKIEAILSLWLYSVKSHYGQEEGSSRSKQTFEDESDSLLRAKESPEGVGLKVFGTNCEKRQLLRDLRWWIPKGIEVLEVLEIWPSEKPPSFTGGKTIDSIQCRVIGSGMKLGFTSKSSQDPDKLVVYNANPLQFKQQLSDDESDDKADDESLHDDHDVENTTPSNCLETWLAIESFDSLEKLYVQDLFFAFMSAMATCGDVELLTIETEVVPQKSNDDPINNLRQFALTNTTLSRLVHEVHGIGIGSLQEAWFGLITPFSLHEKLPIGNLLTQHAQLTVEKFQSDREFDKMGEACCWMLDQAMTFNWQSHARPRALAMVLRLLSDMRLVHTQAEKQSHSDKRSAEMFLSSLSPKIKSWKKRLRNLPRPQSREWLDECIRLDFVQEFQEDDPTEYGIPRGCLLALGKPIRQAMRRLASFSRWSNFLDWTSWHYASTLTQEDEDICQAFLTHVFVDSPDIWGWTVLHYACWQQREWLLKMALSQGANINARGNDGVSPMHCAVRSGDKSIVKLLINQPPDLQQFQSNPDYLGRHPIHWAAVEGHVDIVELLEGGLDLQDAQGNTVLHLAVMYRDTSLVKFLINRMTIKTINRRNLDLRSALGCAMEDYEGREGIVTMIVEKGADLSRWGSPTMPLLNYAILRHLPELARLMLDKGAPVDEVDIFGQVALHIALIWGMDVDTIEALLKSDRSMNGNAVTLEMQDSEGRTPLHIAVSNAHERLSGYRDFLSRFLEYNPEMNFNITNKEGKTALELAKRPEIRDPLIEQIEKQKEARRQRQEESETAASSAQ